MHTMKLFTLFINGAESHTGVYSILETANSPQSSRSENGDVGRRISL